MKTATNQTAAWKAHLAMLAAERKGQKIALDSAAWKAHLAALTAEAWAEEAERLQGLAAQASAV